MYNETLSDTAYLPTDSSECDKQEPVVLKSVQAQHAAMSYALQIDAIIPSSQKELDESLVHRVLRPSVFLRVQLVPQQKRKAQECHSSRPTRLLSVPLRQYHVHAHGPSVDHSGLFLSGLGADRPKARGSQRGSAARRGVCRAPLRDTF